MYKSRPTIRFNINGPTGPNMNHNTPKFTGETSHQIRNFKIPLKTVARKTKPKSYNAKDYYGSVMGASASGEGTLSGTEPTEMEPTETEPTETEPTEAEPTEPEPAPGATASDISTQSNGLKRKLPTENADTDDEPLPAELTKLFHPLFCELCLIHSNSPKSAQLHYGSRAHDKFITAWLVKWSHETGQPVPKRKFCQPKINGRFHCTICDIQMTSESNAIQHNQGRRHLEAVKALSLSGDGHLGPDGKWTQSKGSAARSNKGAGNRPQKPPVDSKSNDGGDYCGLCRIVVSAKSEMMNHLRGIKHAQKLKVAGVAPYTPIPNDTILMSVQPDSLRNPATLPNDHSINRTPSGYFYCKPCNMMLSSEAIFVQHKASKKHHRRIQMYYR